MMCACLYVNVCSEVLGVLSPLNYHVHVKSSRILIRTRARIHAASLLAALS
jgi:hypothetical protein